MTLPKGKGAREYSKFRETRNGLTAVGVTNEDEAIPVSKIVNNSGDTELIASPGATNYIVVKGFHFTNSDSSVNTVHLKAGTGGQNLFSTTLAANGGNFDVNLLGRYWRLPINKALVINLESIGEIGVTIEYELAVEPAQEAVTTTDSITFAESIAKDATTPLGDSQSITEGISATEVTTEKEDSLAIEDEEIYITGNRTEALADPLAIMEAVANSATLSLSDSENISINLDSVTLTPGE